MIWNELTKVALLGADRTNLPQEIKVHLQSRGVDLNKELAQVLLDSLALFHAFRKADFPLTEFQGVFPEPIDTFQQEDIDQVRPYLEKILKGSFLWMFDEFVDLCIQHNRLIPAEYLPKVLKLLIQEPQKWSTTQKVIGPIGFWLVQMNPEWNILYPTPAKINWIESSLEDRVLAIKGLRQRNPEMAIALLEVHWTELAHQHKVALLKQLSIQLSMKDEAFLEAALADNRKEVRLASAILLSSLPNSSLVDRLFHAAKTMIFIDNNGGVQLALPDTLSKELQRDGIQVKAPKGVRGGKKIGWVYQLLTKIPPEKWLDHFQRKPDKIILAFMKSNWPEMGYNALAHAALLHQDKIWIKELVSYGIHRNDRFFRNTPIGKKLFSALSEEAFLELVEPYVQYNQLLEEEDLITQLISLGIHPWSDQLSIQLIKAFQNWLNTTRQYDWSKMHYIRLLRVGSIQASANVVETLEKGWFYDAPLWHSWANEVNQFLMRLRFRRDMKVAFENNE